MDAPSDRDLTLAPSSSRRFTGESHATRSTGIPGTPEHGPAAHDATARPDGLALTWMNAGHDGWRVASLGQDGCDANVTAVARAWMA